MSSYSDRETTYPEIEASAVHEAIVLLDTTEENDDIDVQQALDLLRNVRDRRCRRLIQRNQIAIETQQKIDNLYGPNTWEVVIRKKW